MEGVKNSLLGRREVIFSVESASNPGFVEALRITAEKFKSKEENVVIKSVRSSYGKSSFDIEAFIYDSPEGKIMVEPKIKVKKVTS
ncbi:MAG: hypothetical protein AABW79_01230 [Nanoarchaeota archaeon]